MSNAIIPFNEVQGMAKVFHSAGVFKDVTSEAQAVVKIMAGAELDLPPLYSMQNFYLVKGKIGTSANTLAYLVKRGGKYNYTVTAHDDTKCVIIFTENNKEIYTSTFTIEDAKKAGLTGNPTWTQYPRAMLFSRALSQGARIACPDAIGGVYTKEELDGVEVPMVAPQAVKPPTPTNPPAQAIEAPKTAAQSPDADLWAQPEVQPAPKAAVDPALASLWAAVCNITVELKTEAIITKYLEKYAVTVKAWNPGIVPEGLTAPLAKTVKTNLERQREVAKAKAGAS